MFLPLMLAVAGPVFVTYGSGRFSKAAAELIRSAERTGVFEEVLLYQEIDVLSFNLSADAREVMALPRGGGYWLWKPLIIEDVLNHLQYGDTLLYADAGCKLKNRPAKIRSVIGGNEHITTCDARGGPRTKYGRADVNAFLGTDDAYFEELEHEAGRIVVRKTKKAVEVIKQWANVARTHPRFFTDDPSAVTNLPTFMEHRHDQTIFNLVMYNANFTETPCSYDGWLLATRCDDKCIASKGLVSLFLLTGGIALIAFNFTLRKLAANPSLGLLKAKTVIFVQ